MSSSVRTHLVTVAFVASAVLSACSGTSGGNESSNSEAGGPTGTTAAPEVALPGGPARASSGCDADSAATPSDGDKVSLGDSDRWYLLSTPEDLSADEPLPVVLDFHGLGEGADRHAAKTKLAEYGRDHNFIVVTPQGSGDPVTWAIAPDLSANADLQYVGEVLDQLDAERCIDTSRIYATGLSGGSFMTSTVACTMTDRIAAVAPVTGLARPDGCHPSRPIPVLTFHGTDDPIMLFNGGIGSRLNQVMGKGGDIADEDPIPEADLNGSGFPATAQEWATGNGCTGESVDEELTKTVIERTWDCPTDAPVEFLIIEGGGHTWPGSEATTERDELFGPIDTSIDANEQIWDFVSQFQLPGS